MLKKFTKTPKAYTSIANKYTTSGQKHHRKNLLISAEQNTELLFNQWRKWLLFRQRWLIELLTLVFHHYLRCFLQETREIHEYFFKRTLNYVDTKSRLLTKLKKQKCFLKCEHSQAIFPQQKKSLHESLTQHEKSPAEIWNARKLCPHCWKSLN